MGFKIALCTCIVFLTACYAQNTNSPVAVFGDEVITKNEFRTRFELTPRLGKNTGNIDSVKKVFLQYLLAEKLWAKEASELGYDCLLYTSPSPRD